MGVKKRNDVAEQGEKEERKNATSQGKSTLYVPEDQQLCS